MSTANTPIPLKKKKKKTNRLIKDPTVLAHPTLEREKEIESLNSVKWHQLHTQSAITTNP